MAIRDGYLKLGNLTIHHTYGGSGSPVLIIHGLSSSGYIEWRFNLVRTSRSHRVYAPDLPGYGRSDKPRAARYGIPYFAKTIDRYMQNRHLRGAAVVGTSMGGRIALELALRYPERVGKLVLVNSLGLGRPRIQPYYPVMLLPRGVVRVNCRPQPSHRQRCRPQAWPDLISVVPSQAGQAPGCSDMVAPDPALSMPFS